ncbi:1-acyl-sn-glycerol-3-phosphate acyltransferase [Mycolicibacterium sp.]|uniref:1-acyl-sn-glycerol-3-phosphate acyltransferase n=1 Tax=Mycolicibacterium sp. TaxID=2320850 RepID=UPI001A281E27|nr:1-acyl-sn-glycerol-3-phosphate acyltransferase [Mycolicibacterium sp.]MBJ7337156.1 1-acyl-sn-glycerol-3-phosphate acyltransferase [Mycolicibacterium sp.]
MADNDVDGDALTKWDPALTKRLVDVLRPIVNRYFRFEVHDLGRIPASGALLVSNHSGGTVATDIPTFSVAFYDQFGYERPIYTLSHDILSVGLTKDFFLRAGFIPASRDNAARALAADAVVMVFPGGDHDAMRPTLQQNVIDFKGRTGYVKTAIDAGVPIVPVVSIGGQETQFFLTRGTWLAKRLGLKRLLRSELFPISVGFPFGLSVGAVNLPLPTKIVTQVLEPIDIAAEFGTNADVAAVDARVRDVMQTALNRLASERRFPVLG